MSLQQFFVFLCVSGIHKNPHKHTATVSFCGVSAGALVQVSISVWISGVSLQLCEKLYHWFYFLWLQKQKLLFFFVATDSKEVISNTHLIHPSRSHYGRPIVQTTHSILYNDHTKKGCGQYIQCVNKTIYIFQDVMKQKCEDWVVHSKKHCMVNGIYI